MAVVTATALNHSFVPWRWFTTAQRPLHFRGPFVRPPISRLILYVHNATSSRGVGRPQEGEALPSKGFYFSYLRLYSLLLALSLVLAVTNFAEQKLSFCTLRGPFVAFTGIIAWIVAWGEH